MKNRTVSAHKAALKIASIYGLFSIFWIAFSDQTLFYLVQDPEVLTQLQMLKGWIFVIVTAGIVYALLLRELTVSKNIEETLGDREKRLGLLFDQAADAIYVSRLDGQLVEFNRQACQESGYDAEELVCLNVADIDADMETVEEFRLFASKLESEKPVTLLSHHRRKDGTVFPVEITISLVDSPSGKRVFGIARDISERAVADSL